MRVRRKRGSQKRKEITLIHMGVGKTYPFVGTGSTRVTVSYIYHSGDCWVTSQKAFKKSSLFSLESEIIGLLRRCLEGVMAGLQLRRETGLKQLVTVLESLLLLLGRGFNWTLGEELRSLLMSPKFFFLSCLWERWKFSSVRPAWKSRLVGTVSPAEPVSSFSSFWPFLGEETLPCA